ncbi:lytic transglycosylase domain-containing protein [Paraburkholderia atlantica]|uniref:lytic transglycosylase domain-containing protein n=1 Tax=Paraburkholderia atlantica TaxID=2654982 RepID=UPI0015922962|nr:lytic transglycosylase domain-containing protein [Paraburkholderia atlantica]
MGSGIQGLQQGYSGALNAQRQMLQLAAMQGLAGVANGGQQATQQSAAPSYSSLFGPTSTAPATMPTPQPPAQQASPAAGSGSSGGTIYGKTPQQLFQQGMLMNMAGIQGGGELMRVAVEHDPALAMQMPTEMQRNAAAAYGYGTPEYTSAITNQVKKAGYQEPVNARPGAILRDPYTMQPIAFNPNMPAGTTPTFDASGNVVGASMIPGVTNALSQESAAKTAGEGSQLPYAGVDSQGNPLPVTNRTAAATQAGATTPASAAIVQTESNGNPNAVSPKGAQGAWQVMPNTTSNPGFGVTPAQNNSRAELDRVGRDYYNAMSQRYGSPTIGAIAYNMGPGATDNWLKKGGNWEQLPQETRNYVGKVSTLTALNSGAGVPAPQGNGQIYAAPPMGASTAANTSQGAPSKQMADSYGSLSSADASYQQSREALTEMIHLAGNKGLAGGAIGLLPEGVSTRISPDAATYQKLHATYVALQGKALGSGGTDASRATIDEAVPTYDKPQPAMVQGLTTQLNNLDLAHLKTQFLTPIYQKGDEKSYTQQSAAFDQNIKPSMIPMLQMSGEAQRASVQAAIKANPSLRANFEWAFNNGLLK